MKNCPYPLEKIYSKIDMAEIVSFDVFDTLIKRNVSKPKDIFLQVQQTYNSTHNKKIENYIEQRIEAQKKARLAHLKDDYTFEELYNFLEYEDSIKNELKKIEIEAEFKFCTVNEWMKKVYDYCLANKKTIIIVSDMYFEESVIESILNKNGYKNYDRLYVSSKYRLRKRNGLLFKKVLSDFNKSPKKFFHIGDSYKSDYLFAKKNGMNALHIPTKINNLSYFFDAFPKTLEEEIFLNFLNNNIVSQQTREEQIGFEIFGPILFGYIKWLREMFLEKKLNNVFFCSRDMYVIYPFFKQYFKEFTSQYFYISRKSIRGAYLYKHPTLEEISDVLSVKQMSIQQFLKNINVPIESIKQTMEECNLKLLSTVNLANPSNDFQNFVTKIKDNIIDCNEKKYKLFLSYLKQMNFQGEIALVDTGWNATSQYCLAKIVDDVKIHGFYIGLEPKAYERTSEELLNGYLFSQNRNTDLIPLVISFKQVFESVLAGTQQSVVDYQANSKNLVMPVLDETNSEMPTFAFGVQKGIKAFLENSLEEMENFACSEKFLFYGISKIATSPDIIDVKILTNFQNNNLEVYSYNYPTKSILYYLVHPKFFAKEFKQAPWKVGYLKALLKINLPYYKMYKALKKITKRVNK